MGSVPCYTARAGRGGGTWLPLPFLPFPTAHCSDIKRQMPTPAPGFQQRRGRAGLRPLVKPGLCDYCAGPPRLCFAMLVQGLRIPIASDSAHLCRIQLCKAQGLRLRI